MDNVQEQHRSLVDQKPSTAIKWLVVAFVVAVMLFLGIKLAVFGFIHNAPEGFFARTDRADKSAGVTETVDMILYPATITESGYKWQTLPSVAPSPIENPVTPGKVLLGEKLFFDKNLSFDRSLSCASCHGLLELAGADGKVVATGIYGQQGDRNVPTVWNAAFQRRLFWDGRSETLEHQALQPFLNPIEMGMRSAEEVEKRVRE